MKKLLCAILFTLFPFLLSAQKLEISAFANGGLFSYAGANTTNTSGIVILSYAHQPPSTINPFGNKRTFSYGGGMQFKLMVKPRMILGLLSSYEILKSDVAINSVSEFPYD